ncbi:MAG: histidinol dehydrogenase [Limnobacter sp.]|jgi:histidinol dehydrogenase|uniref:histidinol dehydrogenase n=1 Tax=unclassified Limnobacter TaxID=2630203 RepID=UPI000C529B69|nr:MULTISPECIES: histidinol dehydrogenase [unclassified Limnobacter]MAG79339.1 histidinol dehydrogenase [Sutterellaceae bacterium]MBT84167.1 histidinol dehydrogenase [Sutterellaceae bacterium]MDZ4048774.1 histidinol dehydrogenase [Limnobacter sp.]RZO90704.1 MAG: histidinol dehydrogenase [Limnobacter sp.]|tara:strand:- start:12924 stop:14246 length:1323 start_codon:yes stop_codon:yes gene_type:complete
MSSQIRRLSTEDANFAEQFRALLAYEEQRDPHVEGAVADIIHAVRKRGDEALLEFTEKFDRVKANSAAELEIGQAELKQAFDTLDSAQREALKVAAQRVRAFHERQVAESWEFTEADGTRLGQRVTPLDRAGLYVPGGKAAYPSSVLMNAVPAKVAGVKEVIMVVPTPSGVKNQMVLAAAHLAGVDRVFTIGGAQAVAALAYGTQTVPRVDKIVGPGNAYVAEAKRRVFGAVGIDMIAGPSEILVICDGSTNADWIAMDLFSQAEHDEMAQSILLSPSKEFLDNVQASIKRLMDTMLRATVIATSLKNRGALIQVRDMDEACELSNQIAPEHLELSVQDPDAWVGKLRHAGAIFMGPYSSESLGDYCAGPNHVLPTAGTARFSSPLGVYDFQKRSSIIFASREGASTLGEVAAELAYGEGLPAHARSAEYRVGPKFRKAD